MKKIKGVEHIFFDLDHTLWDFDRNSKLAYQQIFDEFKLDLPLDKFIEVYVPLNLKFWRLYRINQIGKEELRYQRLKAAFDACGYLVEDTTINTIADLYIEYLPNYNHLFPNCHTMLESLVKNYQLHIITNGFEEVQARKIAASGLDRYFKVVLTAEAAGVKKPDPAIFLLALEKAGATARESLMIGDSYEADIQGAKSVGMQTLWFNLDETSTFEDFSINRLDIISTLLAL
ncbi:MAG: YjjG family noncanonical pyrimidine nucleotidase [Nonlabens sp.]